MDGMDLCRAVVELDGGIQATVIVSGGEMKTRYVRQGVPVPPARDLEALFIRAELFATMAGESNRLFGKTSYVLTSHEMLDTFIIPLKPKGVLIVPVVKPYDHEGLIVKIGALLDGQDKQI